MPGYIISPNPPSVTIDQGSGPWCSAPQTAEFLAYKRAIEFALDTRTLDLTIGPDAVAHMRHFLNNTGRDYELDMPALMGKSAQLRAHLDDELRQAKIFSETLGAGVHAISSSRRGFGYFRQADDRNLFYAIGGYSYWGQGTARIEALAGNIRRHTLDFEFHFYDRYNWDGGKSVSIAGVKVTDNFMQEFHRQCYAREFDVKGVARSRVVWESTTAANPSPARNPFDVLLKP